MANTKPLLDKQPSVQIIISAPQTNDGVKAMPRPVSLYDNLKISNGTIRTADSNGQTMGDMNANMSLSEQNLSTGVGTRKKTNFSNVPDVCGGCDRATMSRSPSQAIYLTTTVPQNMSSRDIAGRHTPTRQSLRHSRMIVMRREGKGKYIAPTVQSHNSSLSLAIIMLVIGITLFFMAIWCLVRVPETDHNLNSYWSAFILIISGGLNLLMLSCCRKEYSVSNMYYVTAFKMLCLLSSAAAMISSFVASLYIILHLNTSGINCEGTFTANTALSEKSIDSDKILHENLTNNSDKLNYEIICSYTIYTLLTYISAALNGVAVVICLIYLYLSWKGMKYYKYAKVKTKDNQNIDLNQFGT